MRITIPVNIGDKVVDKSDGKTLTVLGVEYRTGRCSDDIIYTNAIGIITENGIKYLKELRKGDKDYEYLHDLYSV